MVSLLKKLFQPKAEELQAKQRYVELVEYSRAPELFTLCGLPDTLDGRYESIVIALFKEEQKLEDTPATKEYLRNLQEAFFEDMDRSLRENGIGDTGVGKRVKSMASGLYGRLQAYRDAVVDDNALKTALLRNAYATCTTPPSDAAVSALIQHIKTTS